MLAPHVHQVNIGSLSQRKMSSYEDSFFLLKDLLKTTKPTGGEKNRHHATHSILCLQIRTYTKVKHKWPKRGT